MLTTIIIIILAFILFAYVAIPLIFPSQTDALPSLRDPVLQDLEEEKEALFRAIKELDAREDLALERREQLRARYEAKAAKVLRSLDDYKNELKGKPAPKRATQKRRIPYPALSLLGIVFLMATIMSAYVLPRVGQNATVTTFFEDDLEAARALRDLQRAANRTPNAENLLALADAYWQLEDAENAEATYLSMTTDLDPVPAIAYRRLGFLKLQVDIPAALAYLEQARDIDPNDLETLFALGEVYFSQAQPDKAIETLETYLALPEGSGDEEIQARLELFRSVAPVLNEATNNPNEDSLLALGDVYWQQEERERAADIYVQVISNFNPHAAIAYSRLGQVLFFSGRNDQAIDMLERAKENDNQDLTTLLFLGNAYFSTEQFEQAINTWEAYIEVAGSEEAAGRVPGLIESAQARLSELQASTPPNIDNNADPSVQQASAEQLYAANCSSCHGSNGQGGVGPSLVANKSATNEANVRNIIQYGRGNMPGFIAQLEADKLEILVQYVITKLAAEQSSDP